MKKREWALNGVLLTLVATAYFVMPERRYLDLPAPTTIQQHLDKTVRTDPVKEALESTFELRFDDLDTGGTAFLVGRERSGDTFVYKALSAYHVTDGAEVYALAHPDKDIIAHITFNSWRTGKIEALVKIKLLDRSSDLDWSSFSFELDQDRPCLQLATQDVFDNLSPIDTVYLLGAEDLEGIMVHATNVAAISNVLPTPDKEQFDPKTSEFAFHKFPLTYFRVDFVTIPGASGGPILDKDGRVLGILTAFWCNTSLALKAPVILSQVGASDSLFVIEK